MLKESTRPTLLKILYILLFSLAVFSFVSCSDDDDDDDDLVGDWTELSDLDGVPRSDAVAFVIGTKAYIGTGYDGEDRLKDFWEYDSDLNSWTRIADFPGTARNGAVAFATDSKGYVGTGYDGSDKLQDFYEYDPSTNEWTQIADFPGSARYGAVAFAIDNIGYVGTGYDDNVLKDFYSYNPDGNEWTKIISIEGGKRKDAVAFVIDGLGYVCTGIANGSYEDDFWAYDPEEGNWVKKRDIYDVSDNEYDDDYTNIIGTNKVAFTVNGKGYVATGGLSTTGTAVWEYNPDTDLWTQKTSLEASSRLDAVGFAIGDIGYVATGKDGSAEDDDFDDLWGFKPGATQVDLNKIIVVDNSSSSLLIVNN